MILSPAFRVNLTEKVTFERRFPGETASHPDVGERGHGNSECQARKAAAYAYYPPTPPRASRESKMG